MTYGHLQADCLYTGISSGPNARCRVWEAITFLPFTRSPCEGGTFSTGSPGKWLLSGCGGNYSGGCLLYWWDGKHCLLCKRCMVVVTAVKFAHDDKSRLACCSLDGQVSICQVIPPPATVICLLDGHTSGVTGASLVISFCHAGLLCSTDLKN